MASDRTIVCKYYECEGRCRKGRDGTFWHYCQKCNKYDPLKGQLPARTNEKRKKLEKARERDSQY